MVYTKPRRFSQASADLSVAVFLIRTALQMTVPPAAAVSPSAYCCNALSTRESLRRGCHLSDLLLRPPSPPLPLPLPSRSRWLSFQSMLDNKNHLSLAGDEENGGGPLNIHRAELQRMEMSRERERADKEKHRLKRTVKLQDSVDAVAFATNLFWKC